MAKIFLTSDTHFSHRNIIVKLSSWTRSKPFRHFESVEDMNDTLIDSINAVVGVNDILYHLGDFAFGHLADFPKLRERIRCRTIHLISGNHDIKSIVKHSINRTLFSSIIPYYELSYNRKKIILCHYPFLSWNRRIQGSLHCFGHVHNNLKTENRSMDVGVDAWNYEPLLLDDVIQILESRPIYPDQNKNL